MNWSIFASLVGICLGVWAGKILHSLLIDILYTFRFWPKSSFYAVYEICIEQDVPDSKIWFSGIAKRKVPMAKHYAALERFWPVAYGFFIRRELNYLWEYAKSSSLFLLLPALVLRQHIGWLLGGYALGSAFVIARHLYVDGWDIYPITFLRSITIAAYRSYGIKLKELPSLREEPAAVEPGKEVAQNARPAALREYRTWQNFKWSWWGIDALLCSAILINFWVQDVSSGSRWYDTALVSLMIALLMQIFFVPVYVVGRFMARRRLSPTN